MLQSHRLATAALGAAVGLLLAGLGPAPASAADAGARITVRVETADSGRGGLAGLLLSGNRGDVQRLVWDLQERLEHERWIETVMSDPEVYITIDRRERVELRRHIDKKGDETIDHRYTGHGLAQVAGQRITLEAEIAFTEGPNASRDDDKQFERVADALAEQVYDAIFANLDALRPERPQAGFTHKTKFKLLVKGDGLEVQEVEPGSPAEKAGLQVKDRIRRIDDEKNTGKMDYRARTWWTEGAGTRVGIEVERNKQRQNLELTLLPRSNWAEGGPSSQPFTTSSGASSTVSLKPGMTELEVVKVLGQPREKVAFGQKSLWRYDSVSITFQDGRLVDMK